MNTPTHFLAASNFDETCKYCGHLIAPGTLTEELETKDATEYAHASCLEAAEEDAREMMADEMRDGAL